MIITLILNAEEDAAVALQVKLYNAASGNAPETADDLVKRVNRQLLDTWLKIYRSATKLSKADLYAKATPADQAQVDVILAKYEDVKLITAGNIK